MTTLLTRVVAALFIAVGGLLIMGNHVCGCSLFLDPAPESELGRTLTAISRAQEEIHRRHGRFAESGAELMAELRRLRPRRPFGSSRSNCYRPARATMSGSKAFMVAGLHSAASRKCVRPATAWRSSTWDAQGDAAANGNLH